MFRSVNVLAVIALPLVSSFSTAWPVAQPPQFGIFDTIEGEEPDVLEVIYKTDWYDPASVAENYQQQVSRHDGLMIRNDMVLVNSLPFDITAVHRDKFTVRSQPPSSQLLPVSTVHTSNSYNILELGCKFDDVEIHALGFGEITPRRISEEGVSASIYFHDENSNLKRSLQPITPQGTSLCRRDNDYFCLSYLIESWARQIREHGSNGSPVFYTDTENTTKIIGVLRNDYVVQHTRAYQGGPVVYHTHIQTIDFLEDFIVRTIGVPEWISAMNGESVKGNFIVNDDIVSDDIVNGDETPAIKLCSASLNSETFPGFIGQQYEDTDSMDHPAGCIVLDSENTVTVASEYSVLKGKPAYDWSDYSPELATTYFTANDSNKIICRHSHTQRVGWVKTTGETACIYVSQDGDGAKAFIPDFQVMSPNAEKTICPSALVAPPTDTTTNSATTSHLFQTSTFLAVMANVLIYVL